MLVSDETIVCPKCSGKFPLHEGITKQAMDNYQQEFERESKTREEQLGIELSKEADKRAAKAYAAKEAQLFEKLSDKEEALSRTQSLLKKVQAEERTKAESQFELERKGLEEELQKKESAIKQFREEELALRREKQQLGEEKQNLELENQRKLDEERQKIQEQATKLEADKFRLKEAEYRKKLENVQKVNEELTRKLEQGSQQFQGEVFELQLEEVLRSSFPHDKIEAVRKGVRGADVLQRVYTATGQLCGTIIWEAKRAEAWSDKWIEKLKDDQLEAKAELAVVVTTTLPNGIDKSFAMVGDIWVATDGVIKPIAQTLRLMLIEANKLRLMNTGKNEKMELLYNYLSSAQFTQRVRAVVETFVGMKKDLDQEKNAILKLWKKREGQIDRVATSMSGMVGELQAIAQDSLPQLEGIEQLSLPVGEDTIVQRLNDNSTRG
jgi:hypothetical protein